MNTAELIQGSAEWKAARLGKITASKISAVMAKTKNGPSAEREKYKYDVISELLSGVAKDVYISQAMQWGIDNEGYARQAYENLTGELVTTCGFVPHPTLELAGASPDGLCSLDGAIEIKCPETSTHLKTIETGEIDQKYIYQMQWAMACTERNYCDFVTYDPRLPEPLKIKVIRVNRDEEMIALLEAEVKAFQEEIEKTLARIIENSGE